MDIQTSTKTKENLAFLRKKRKEIELNLGDFDDFNEFYPKIHKNSLVIR